MRIRLLALVACAVFTGATAHADERAFKREDYESYFAPGRFATWSPFYESHGAMEMVSRRSSQPAGKYLLEQTTKSFDVSVNYDTHSDYKFYKIESLHTDQMTWDARRGAYVYDYTDAEFREETAHVWESHDDNIDLSRGDKSRGELQQFYRDADRRAGQDPVKQENDFRKQVIGGWSWRCAWVNDMGYDVLCRAVHDGSGRTETFYYRKMDLVG